jgi:uncharacterized membrane protein
MISKEKHSGFEAYSKAVSLGAVAGLRAMTAPALFSHAASTYRKNEFGDNWLASSFAPPIAATLAVGEIIGDKLPWTPNRTETPGLLARVVSGAVIGGSICAGYKKSVPFGSALGALSAIAAAYAGQNIRRSISKKTGIPSPVLGGVEDIIAVGIGASALKRKK